MNTPPVLAVSGSQGLLRRRFLKSVIEGQQDQGWDLLYADGKDLQGIEDAMTQPVFATETVETLIVVTHPEKVPLAWLEAHHKVKKPDTILLLHVEGDPDGRTKFAKFLKTIGKCHKHFPKPKFWEEEKAATDFCVVEAKRYGLTLKTGLAGAMVNLVGTDLGFLSFEILKVATLAELDGSKELLAKHMKGALAPVSGAVMEPIKVALRSRDKKKLMRSLGQLKAVSKDDPTMWVCRSIGAMALKWIGVVEMVALGLPADEAAVRLRQNPWYYRTKLVPEVVRWKPSDVVKLVKAMAESERVLLRGSVDPWKGLVARLLWVCG